METELAEAGSAYKRAPAVLQAAILKAAAAGVKAPTIFHAIGGAYSLDYVRELIGEARKAGTIPPRRARR